MKLDVKSMDPFLRRTSAASLKTLLRRCYFEVASHAFLGILTLLRACPPFHCNFELSRTELSPARNQVCHQAVPNAHTMGLFSSTPSHANPPPSSDGAFIAPGRQKRARCYEARDRFFACLEQNGIIDSIKDKEQADKACSSEDRGMGMECAASWVRKKIRVSTQRCLYHGKAEFKAGKTVYNNGDELTCPCTGHILQAAKGRGA